MPEAIARLTKRGEGRIDKCRKLDLGGGYRLIYFVDGAVCILPYIAAHDECDRWLKRNTGFEVIADDARCKAISNTNEDWEYIKSQERLPVHEDDDEEHSCKRLMTGFFDVSFVA